MAADRILEYYTCIIVYSLVTIQNGQFSLWYNRTLSKLHILQSDPWSRIDHLHSKHNLEQTSMTVPA